MLARATCMVGLCGALAIGCGADTAAPAPTHQLGPTFGAAAGSGSVATGSPANVAKPNPAAGSGSVATGSPVPTTTPQPAPASGNAVPCDVAKAVGDHCSACHSMLPQFGAPMPLMTLADFHAPAKSNAMLQVAQIIPTRINATDTSRLMPPISSPQLLPADLTAFNSWLSGGAQGVANGCPIMPISMPATAPTGAPAPTDPTLAASGPRSGGASLDAQEYNDPEMKCYQMLTHAQGDGNADYMQAPGEQYWEFTFKAAWTGTQYLRSVRPIIRNPAPVLHHWLLFKDTSMGSDGAIVAGTGAHIDGAVLIHGWAPGASPIYYDPDVGMKMESNVTYTVEAHMYNSGSSAGPDHSGPELCVTTKVPTHVVDINWVGTDNIAGTSAQGTCHPANAAMPIHLIGAQPHMHKTGMHMKEVVTRAGGMAETIHDDDFSFDDQRYYLLNTVLMSGDTMSTTCTYRSPATFGSSTNQEMCYFFTIAWPAGAIGAPSLIHGANTCLQ
jgi:hypothetical protein